MLMLLTRGISVVTMENQVYRFFISVFCANYIKEKYKKSQDSELQFLHEHISCFAILRLVCHCSLFRTHALKK